LREWGDKAKRTANSAGGASAGAWAVAAKPVLIMRNLSLRSYQDVWDVRLGSRRGDFNNCSGSSGSNQDLDYLLVHHSLAVMDANTPDILMVPVSNAWDAVAWTGPCLQCRRPDPATAFLQPLLLSHPLPATGKPASQQVAEFALPTHPFATLNNLGDPTGFMHSAGQDPMDRCRIEANEAVSPHYSREMRDQSQTVDIAHNYANGLFDEVFCNEISGPGVWWPRPISGGPMNYSG